MTLIDEPEFSVDRLAARMREASAENLAAGPAQLPVDSLNGSSPVGSGGADQTPPLSLQPAFQPHDDDRYQASDLLRYHDRNFIQNAYRAILKRGPDATGFKTFIEALRTGRLNKIDILARLRYSSEGRAKKVQINGLFVPALIRQSYRVPVLGYFLHWVVALARLPNTMRSQQQFEAHMLAQQEQLVDFANHLNEKLAHLNEQLTRHTASLAGLSSSIQTSTAEQRRQTESLISEQQAILAAQQALSAAQQAAQDEARLRLDELAQRVEARLGEEAAAWRKQLQELDARLGEEAAVRHGQLQELDARLATETSEREKLLEQGREQQRLLERDRERQRLFERELAQLDRQLRAAAGESLEVGQRLRTELTLQGQRLARLLEELARPASPLLDQPQLEAIADEEQHTLDALYVTLEERFRGSRAEIKERLRAYLPLLKRAGIGTDELPVLDIGSGRGEWLELLGEEGLLASGVDHNRVLVAECRERGLDVSENDMMRYLHSLPDESLGAVTGFHIVEHLPVETLIKLLDETVRVIKPGGVCIFETPNPQNVLVGSCNFYFDPTHRNPLPGPVLKFFVESRGFARVEVINLNPSTAERVKGDSDLVKRFNQYFYGPMDYAVVGWRVDHRP